MKMTGLAYEYETKRLLECQHELVMRPGDCCVAMHGEEVEAEVVAERERQAAQWQRSC
jgi:hypothetical protein